MDSSQSDVADSLPEDEFERIEAIVALYEAAEKTDLDALLDLHAQLYSAIDVSRYRDLEYEHCYEDIDFDTDDEDEIVNFIEECFDEVRNTIMVRERRRRSYERHLSKYANQFVNFRYEFTKDDKERAHHIISELRRLLSSSKVFEEKHRRRLLIKLERLQKELHLTVSSMDHFWGLIGDAGVALGKFGDDVRPLVERIRELADIAWRTQANAEGLPRNAPFPQLPKPEPKGSSERGDSDLRSNGDGTAMFDNGQL